MAYFEVMKHVMTMKTKTTKDVFLIELERSMDGIAQEVMRQLMIFVTNNEEMASSLKPNNEKTETLTVLTGVAQHVKQKTDGTESTMEP